MATAGSSQSRDVVVRISVPEPDPEQGGDFRVLVEIDGLDEPYSHYFHGVDDLQAFLSGCWIVGEILPSLAPAGATITWLGSENLGFGP
jgi:hypothetical protein